MALRSVAGAAMRGVRSIRQQSVVVTRSVEVSAPKISASRSPWPSRFFSSKDPDSLVRDNIKAAVSKALKEALGHLKNDGSSNLKISVIKSGVNAAVTDSLKGHTVIIDSAEHLDLLEEFPEKHLVSFVVDGNISEAEIETLFDNKMRTALRDSKDEASVVAIEQMCRNLDLALQGVRWNQQVCFEKLEARVISHSLLLEDVHNASTRMNFVDAALRETGRKMFHKKVIWAKQRLVTLVPYASRYYFYCLSAYSLLKCDVPLRPIDYALIVLGA